MRFYLEPKGWPADIATAPSGLLARFRKGRAILYFKTATRSDAPPFVMDMSGNLTTVTGAVTPVILKVEEK